MPVLRVLITRPCSRTVSLERKSALANPGEVLAKLQIAQRIFPASLRRLPRRWRITIRAVVVVLVGLVALTARLFIWPEQGMPSHVDAIVMMNGSGDRLDTALKSWLGAQRPSAGDLPRVAVLGTWQHLRAEDPAGHSDLL